jgi:hypothetical protein
VDGIVVRPATPSDAGGIARVHVRAWQVAYAGLMPAEFLAGLDVQQRTASWQDALSRDADPLRPLVALLDDDVAGFVLSGAVRHHASDDPVRRPGPDTGEVHAINVAPDRWGQDAGQRLLARAEGVRGLVLVGGARSRWHGPTPRHRRAHDGTAAGQSGVAIRR